MILPKEREGGRSCDVSSPLSPQVMRYLSFISYCFPCPICSSDQPQFTSGHHRVKLCLELYPTKERVSSEKENCDLTSLFKRLPISTGSLKFSVFCQRFSSPTSQGFAKQVNNSSKSHQITPAWKDICRYRVSNTVMRKTQ